MIFFAYFVIFATSFVLHTYDVSFSCIDLIVISSYSYIYLLIFICPLLFIYIL